MCPCKREGEPIIWMSKHLLAHALTMGGKPLFLWLVVKVFKVLRFCVTVCCSVLQCVAVCCSVLQCVAVCCSVLQYVGCKVLRF